MPATLKVSFSPSTMSCLLISSSIDDKVDPVSQTAKVSTFLVPLDSRTETTWSKPLQAFAVRTGFVEQSEVLGLDSLLISMKQSIVLLWTTISATSSFQGALIRTMTSIQATEAQFEIPGWVTPLTGVILKAGQFHILWSPSLNGHMPLDKSVLFSTWEVNAAVFCLSRFEFFLVVVRNCTFKLSWISAIFFNQALKTRIVVKLESYL